MGEGILFPSLSGLLLTLTVVGTIPGTQAMWLVKEYQGLNKQ